MKFAHVISTSFALLVSLAGASAAAQDVSDDSSTHTGFFLHGGTGLGYIDARTTGGHDVTLSGVSAVFNGSVGYSVVPGLALHASLFGGVAFSPDLTIDGQDFDTRDDASLNLASLAAGLTYYTPINLYVSAAAGVGFQGVSNSEESASLEPGLAVNAMVGYEWMLTRNLGLGAGLQLFYFRNLDEDLDEHWNSLGGGPMVSLTLN